MGDLTFCEDFLSKAPPWGRNYKSNVIELPTVGLKTSVNFDLLSYHNSQQTVKYSCNCKYFKNKRISFVRQGTDLDPSCSVSNE